MLARHWSASKMATAPVVLVPVVSLAAEEMPTNPVEQEVDNTKPAPRTQRRRGTLVAVAVFALLAAVGLGVGLGVGLASAGRSVTLPPAGATLVRLRPALRSSKSCPPH